MSRQTIFNIIKKLMGKQLIEKHPDTGHLKTTGNWYEKVVIFRITGGYQKSLPIVKEGDLNSNKSLHSYYQDFVPNKENTNNKKELGFPLKENSVLPLTESTSKIVTTSFLKKEEEPLSSKEKGNSKEVTERIINKFKKMCEKELGTSPITGGKEYKMVSRVLNTVGLSEKQVYEMFEEWFLLGKPDADTIHLTRALSNNRINTHRVSYGIR